MDGSAAAPEQPGHPEAIGQTGQPDWAAQYKELEQKVAGYEERERRYKDQIAGSQKEFGVLREHGFKSMSELVPHLGTIKGFQQAGVDPDRVMQAFRPQEPKEETPGLDMKALEDKLFDRLHERHTATERQRALQGTFTQVDKMVEDELKDAPKSQQRLAKAFVRDELTERLVRDASADPGQVLKDIWSDYHAMNTADEASADGKRMVELADQTTAPKRGATPRTEKGGMGQPTDDDHPDHVRSRREAALKRKYAARAKAAMSGSE